MKVAWFSHYKEGSGWSKASIDSILALDSVGVEVVPVNIPLAGQDNEIPERILELEKGSIDDADYCVQNVLPHHMIGTSQYKKNVGFFVTETSTIAHTPWLAPLSAMDELWLPNNDNAQRIRLDIPSSQVFTVPYAFDLERYEGLYDALDMQSANHTYKFYYIGDLNDRKNLEATIRCFHVAFQGNPNVSLVMKVGRHGTEPEKVTEIVRGISTKVKEELRIFKDLSDYSNEIIIPDRLPNKALLDLHYTCDCYVSTSHGEGWGIPIYEAICFGNAVIAGNEGGPKDFLPESLLIRGTEGPCCHTDAAFPFLGTGREMWFNIDERSVVANMQKHFAENKSYRKEGLEIARHYSYESVGKIMKERLQA